MTSMCLAASTKIIGIQGTRLQQHPTCPAVQTHFEWYVRPQDPHFVPSDKWRWRYKTHSKDTQMVQWMNVDYSMIMNIFAQNEWNNATCSYPFWRMAGAKKKGVRFVRVRHERHPGSWRGAADQICPGSGGLKVNLLAALCILQQKKNQFPSALYPHIRQALTKSSDHSMKQENTANIGCLICLMLGSCPEMPRPEAQSCRHLEDTRQIRQWLHDGGKLWWRWT